MTDKDYLAHIERAIREIRAHTAGMTQQQYEADTKTQRAVERNLQIVGEAVRKLSLELKLANPDIPWDEVSAARNVIVHQYFGVDQKILWDVLQEDLEPLLAPRPRAGVRAIKCPRSQPGSVPVARGPRGDRRTPTAVPC